MSPASPLPDLTTTSRLVTWNVAIDGSPQRSLQCIGRWLLWIGAGAMIAGMFLTPPWVNGGLAAAILGLLLSRPPVHRLTAVWFGVAYTVWLLAAALVGMVSDRPGTQTLPGETYGWLAMPLVAACVIDSRWRRWAIRIAIVVGTLGIVLGILQFTIGFGKGFAGIDPQGTRFFRSRGFNTMHLTFGFTAALLAVIAAQPSELWGIHRAWSWIGRLASLAGLGVCGSRAGSVAGIAGLATTLLGRGGRWLIGGLAIGALAAGLIIFRMQMTDPGRLQKMMAFEDGRWLIWRATATMIQEHPLTGIGGRKAYKQAYNDVYHRTLPGVENEFEMRGNSPGAPHAHNWLLAEAAEYGIPAAILHLALVGAVLVTCWQNRRTAPGGWTIALGTAAVGVVGGMFEPYPTQSVPGIAFHACLGLALGLSCSDDGRTQPDTTAPGEHAG